jgi:hypothetical protein
MSEKDIHKNIKDAEMQFFLEADKDAIQQSLREHITDMDSYRKKRDKAIAKIRFLAKANANKVKDDNLLQVVADKFMDAINKGIDKPIQILKHALEGKSQLALNNNLKQLSREHLIELIQDKNLVHLLEELEKDGTDYPSTS